MSWRNASTKCRHSKTTTPRPSLSVYFHVCLSVCLSICLPKLKTNICFKFWTIRNNIPWSPLLFVLIDICCIKTSKSEKSCWIFGEFSYFWEVCLQFNQWNTALLWMNFGSNFIFCAICAHNLPKSQVKITPLGFSDSLCYSFFNLFNINLSK